MADTVRRSGVRRRGRARRRLKSAPNVLVVLIDDVGTAQSSAARQAEVITPTMGLVVVDKAVAYNRFHTTAMCSPTRAAAFVGGFMHRVGSGQIIELANDWDGYAGVISKSSVTVAEVLKDYGYATSAFGKWHNTYRDTNDRRRSFRLLARWLRLQLFLRLHRR